MSDTIHTVPINDIVEHLTDGADCPCGGEDDSGGYTYLRYRCTDTREWVQRGMLHAALEQAAEKDLDEDED